MKDKEVLAKEIVDHLRLYDDLGVRWARRIEPRKKSAPPQSAKGNAAVSAGAKKGPAKTAYRSMERDRIHSHEIIRRPSMQEEEYMGWTD